jgi:hypothetical protein
LEPGPTLFVTAALHGDELNGTGIVRELMLDRSLELRAGTLILVPVVNILGFDRHSRYLPDRRDLNRCFPGSASGSLARRTARVVFDEIVARSDYGVDLHTAAVRRTNFPNVRADLSNAGARRLAEAFGCEYVVASKGPEHSLRREATGAGCPVILFEGGEIWKMEPSIIHVGVQGIKNVMIDLGMIEGQRVRPAFSGIVDTTRWIRAEQGGVLQFHVGPGDVVSQGAAMATSTGLLGEEQSTLIAPFDGVVIGMTTLPAATPGEPVVHLGKLARISRIERIRAGLPEEHPHGRTMGDLATNVLVTDAAEADPELPD